MKPLHIILLSALFIVLPITHSCRTADQSQTYIRDGREYGITQGIFRDRWWNYYERGISFGQGDFLNEAENDLRTAISQRQEDQRMARTYGLHFIDYFPHRELGVVLFKKQQYREAILELERSLAGEESAKAKFYLNKAIKSLLMQEPGESASPEIRIDAPFQNQYVNTFSTRVKGRALSGNHVMSLQIKGQPEFIELAEKTLDFDREVDLHPGMNHIPVTAGDLLGKTGEKTVTVFADYQGPSLGVINFSDGQEVKKKEIMLELSYADESGIAFITVENKKTHVDGSKSGIIETAMVLNEGENIIRMEALDIAGNKTSGQISLNFLPRYHMAFNDVPEQPWKDTGNAIATDAMFFAKKENSPDDQGPEISFRGLLKVLSDNDSMTVKSRKNNNQFFIECQVSDMTGVNDVFINDKPVPVIKGKIVVFNKFVELKEGANQFKITARDVSGNTTSRSVTVTRQIQQIDLDSSKLTLSIMPFKTTRISPGIEESIYNLFMQEIINSGRFNIVERGPDFETILRELKLSQTDLVDKEFAVKTGRLLASEAVIIGSIVENEHEIEVYAKLVNVETSEYITLHDVYGQDKSRSQIEYLMAGLASEIVYSVPLITGQVLAVKGGEIFLNIGKTSHFNIKEGLKCLIYQSTPFIVDGVNLGNDTTILGTVVLNRVQPKFSSAVMVNAGQESGITIKKDDKVITK